LASAFKFPEMQDSEIFFPFNLGGSRWNPHY
jgi:hypothetical protein